MDGRSSAAGTGKAASCGSGGGMGVAYEACGYKQGWADGREDGQADGHSAILARICYSPCKLIFAAFCRLF